MEGRKSRVGTGARVTGRRVSASSANEASGFLHCLRLDM